MWRSCRGCWEAVTRWKMVEKWGWKSGQQNIQCCFIKVIFKRSYNYIKHIFLDLSQSLTWLDTPVCWDQGSLLPQEVRPRNLQHWDLQWPHHGHCNCSQVLTTWTGQWWATTTTAGPWDTPVTRSLTLSSELSVMRSKHQIKFNTSILYN